MEALAARAGVSVDTVRYYQARGLLHAPRRQGRVAWYDGSHVERLHRIRSLQTKGFTLATIARILDGTLDAADEALVGALADESARAGGSRALLSVDELSARTGIPVPMLQTAAAEGLLVPHRAGDRSGYTEEDIAAASAGLALLGWGIPLSDLLALAADHHRATVDVARRAVALFDTHVRHRLRDDPSVDDATGAVRLVDAFQALLPATTTLVAHHFTRVLLQAALDHIERVGTTPELRAVATATAAERLLGTPGAR